MDNTELNKKFVREFRLLDRKIAKYLNENEYKLLHAYLETLNRIRHKVSDAFERAGIKGPIKEGEIPGLHFEQMNKYGRLVKLEAEIALEIKALSGMTIKTMASQLKDIFRTVDKMTGETAGSVMGISLDFAKPNNEVILESIKNPYDRVGWKFRTGGHHAKSIQQVKSEITAGLIEGKGFAQTAAEIKTKVNGLANNVTRIVRTESHRVHNIARNQSLEKTLKTARELDVDLVKVISSVMDNRTRPQSAQMHGQMAGKDGLFRYPNGVRGLPGNTGVAEYDINDRETVILQEKSEYLARMKKEGKILSS